MRVDYVIVDRVHVGLGTSGRILWANASGAYAPTEEVGTTAGALVAAWYVVPVGPLAVSAGPLLEGLLRPIHVQVAGAEVFQVPWLVAGLSVEVGTR